MRQRGGSVVLLVDEAVASPALRTLSGVERWTASSRAQPAGTPPASETFSPAAVAPWMQASGPATWSIAVGRGRLVISGQLDGWRYRDRDAAAFDTHWRRAVAEVATAAQQAARAANLRAGDEPSRTPDADDRTLIRAWTASHQGRVVPEAQVPQLAALLQSAIDPPHERVRVRPMRWMWWWAPFALCLGTEWWIRRRSGLR